MDLQPIAIMLELVRPAWPGWGLLGDDWLLGGPAHICQKEQ